MAPPETAAEVVAVIERHVDDVHRNVLRHTTDPGRSLPKFKTRAQEAQDERVLRELLRLLAAVTPTGATVELLREQSYARIDGAAIELEDKQLRRRLQGIPEVAPRTATAGDT